MPVTIPDKGEGASDVQSQLFQEYWDAREAADVDPRDCVVFGCGVTSNNDMSPSVAKGGILSNGVLLPVTAGTVTFGTADATNPRLDLIVANSSGTKAVRAGTPVAYTPGTSTPKPPNRSANDVILCEGLILNGATVIDATKLIDKRNIRNSRILVYKSATAVVFNNTNTIQTYFTLTLPNGMLLANKHLDVRCGGDYLSNSGTGTWTLTISYGGTAMYTSTTVATAADTDRKPWDLDFRLSGVSSTSQVLTGNLRFGTPGTVTYPSGQVGVGGMNVATHVIPPIFGTAAVDSDAADRTLTVQWTMSVNNAAVETALRSASAIFF